MLETGLYFCGNIYNMDEAFFELSSGRRTCRVAPRTTSIKAQSSLAPNAHITLVATISTQDAPVRLSSSRRLYHGGMGQHKG